MNKIILSALLLSTPLFASVETRTDFPPVNGKIGKQAKVISEHYLKIRNETNTDQKYRAEMFIDCHKDRVKVIKEFFVKPNEVFEYSRVQGCLTVKYVEGAYNFPAYTKVTGESSHMSETKGIYYVT